MGEFQLIVNEGSDVLVVCGRFCCNNRCAPNVSPCSTNATLLSRSAVLIATARTFAIDDVSPRHNPRLIIHYCVRGKTRRHWTCWFIFTGPVVDTSRRSPNWLPNGEERGSGGPRLKRSSKVYGVSPGLISRPRKRSVENGKLPHGHVSDI